MDTLDDIRRAKLCHGHIEPRKVDGRWLCDHCGVNISKTNRNKIGWRHQVVIHEKQCNKCDVTKDVKHFYSRTDSVDGYSGYCRQCRQSDQAAKNRKLEMDGQYFRVWLPKELMQAARKVRGKQTLRDFFVHAIRREVEIRTRAIMEQKAYEQAKKNALTREQV